MSIAPSLRYAAPTRGAVVTPWREMAALCLLYIAATALGFLMLVTLFKAGVLSGTSVLFYRGLVLIVLAGVATLGMLVAGLISWGNPLLRPRDALGAAAISMAFNLCFFVVVPVTVDRSISVFMLGEMNAHAQHAYSTDEMSRLFTHVYVVQDRQIERRLHEQALSGNIEDIGGRYRISPRGTGFIQVSNFVAWMFDSDTRFVAPTDKR